MTRSATATKLGAVLAVSLAFAQAAAPPKVILLVGPPGSGKTTQAKILAKKFAIPSFSMAELVKQEMASRRKDAVSKALAANIASGDLLSDDAATELIRLRLLHEDLRRGFILDGYPATAGQAKALDRMLEDQKLPKALVVVLDAPDDVIR